MRSLSLRHLLIGAVGSLSLAAAAYTLAGNAGVDEAPNITVYKSPTCGCCEKWAEHLEDDGFTVSRVDVRDLGAVKRSHGVDRRLASCHTAVIDGYVVEGHVPAADIRRLLEERPAATGITVPGMPVGSPGMEQGARKDPYTVYTFGGEGAPRPFARH